MPKLLISGLLVVGVFNSGCGGGGGSTPPAPNPPPANQAPTANAGTDRSVREGQTVNLSATGADSDGSIASYSWQQESGANVAITNADTSDASFVAPDVAACEDLVFRVTVTDDDGATGSDTVTVAVSDPAPPPPPTGDFIPLGDLCGGNFFSSASDVSDDGSVVVGTSSTSIGGEAFRWTSATGMVGLGDILGGRFDSGAAAVSADGNVVVGTGWVDDSGADGDEMSPFRWTSASGMVDLGDLDNCDSNWGCRSSEGTDVSADGGVVVGYSNTGFNREEAFRWTGAGGMVSIGELPGGQARAKAFGVSADGTVIVGKDEIDASGTGDADGWGTEAFRWTAATGMVGLGDAPGGEYESGAHDVSADGSVIAGTVKTSSGPGDVAALWTIAGGIMELGFLPGHNYQSAALGISADGDLVLGWSQADDNSATEAFIWTQANGMQSLRDLLIAKGVTGLENWQLLEANSISADGQWVVGTGFNPSGDGEAFLANISVP